MEELSLKWDEHHPAVISVFEELLAKGTLVDCTIAADGQYMKAHKVVLAACSPYFEMLFSQESEKNPIVVLKDMKFQELKHLIDFVYRGQVRLPKDQLDAFVSAAESLQIKGLSGQQKKKISERFANKTVSSREVCSSPVPRKRRRNSHTETNEDSQSEPGNESSSDSNMRENFMPTPVPLGMPCTSTASSSTGISSHSVSSQQSRSLTDSRFPSHDQSSASSEQVLPDVQTVVKTEPEDPTEPLAQVFVPEPKNEEYVDDMAMLESGAGSSNMQGGTSQENTNNYPATGAMERIEEIPQIIRIDAAKAVEDLLPSKSKESYLKEYETFKEWRKEKKITDVCEDAMLAYFNEKSEKYKSSSLWAQYSMLKATMNIYENVDMSRYVRLIAFLKDKHVGYEAKKSKVLTRQQIVEFLNSAPDDIFLMEKVAVVFGVSGACRCDELYSINVDYVQDKGNLLVVTIPRTNTNKRRVFTIMADEMNGVDLYRKYLALRPKKVEHPSLFVSMRRGKCTVQRVGINSFYKIAKTVATYLKLEEPETYTGHSLRRSSATLLAESGTEIIPHKRHGSWRTGNAAEGYVEDSLEHRSAIARQYMGGDVQAGTSASVEGNVYYGSGYNPENRMLEFGKHYF